ncbi:MAG: hypothetical protein RSF40_04935 [Oscillospiraceae bacterium]
MTDVFAQLIKQETGIDVCPEFRFHPTRRWRFDFAIPDLKIAIEQEGGLWVSGRHNRAFSMINDMVKYNTAASMGWLVLRFTPQDMTKEQSIDVIKSTIMYRGALRNGKA